MKKTLLALLLLPAFGGVANADQQTVTLGWSHAKIQSLDSMDGFNVKYRYEGDSPLGLMGSFSWMKGKGDETFSTASHSLQEYYVVKNYSFLLGPAWRLNDYVSLYALAGINVTNAKYDWLLRENNGAGHSAVASLKAKSNYTNFAYGAGIQFNPLSCLSIDVGYEGTQIKEAGQNYTMHGFNVGIGYVF